MNAWCIQVSNNVETEGGTRKTCGGNDTMFLRNDIRYIALPWPLNQATISIHLRFRTCSGWVIVCSWWRHQMETFSALLVLCARNSRVTGEFPWHKGQWRGHLMFSLICAWTNGWVNNRDADDLRRHRAHYDIAVMCIASACTNHTQHVI